MKDFNKFKKEILKNKLVAKEYEKLTPRYRIVSELIAARIKNGITQKELAKRIGTKQSAIARLEGGNVNPSLDFIEKVAFVLGYKLQIYLK